MNALKRYEEEMDKAESDYNSLTQDERDEYYPDLDKDEIIEAIIKEKDIL